jgi:SAM-dependent methyltransferase
LKIRESGMPDEPMWNSFFDPESVLLRLMPAEAKGDVVEFGCGYGTFTIPAARRTSGILYAFDIEPTMAEISASKSKNAGLTNVRTVVRDFVAQGTGLSNGSATYAMLFNILHAEEPGKLLREAYRIVAPDGWLGMMHWNYDEKTPRGPSMDIRPRPRQVHDWALDAGFELAAAGIIDLPPYHYGMMMRKRSVR